MAIVGVSKVKGSIVVDQMVTLKNTLQFASYSRILLSNATHTIRAVGYRWPCG